MSLGDPFSGAPGMLCLALGAALLGGEPERRRAGAGLVLLGLALAAWWAGVPPGASAVQPASLGRGFVVGNAGLLLLGGLLVAVPGLRAPAGPTRLAAVVLLAAGLALLSPIGLAFLRAAGLLRSAGAVVALGSLGIALGAAGHGLARLGPVQRLARRLAPPPLPPASFAGRSPDRHRRLLLGLVILAAAATALGSHTALVFAGVVLGAWTGWLGAHAPGRRPLPVAPVLTLLLVPAYGLLATISGPVGLRVAGLPQVPVSPAAELLAAPALLLAGWALAGLWPLQRQLPGALVAGFGWLLLVRIGHSLLPEGLEYWRPITVPVVLLGLWHAAAHARWALLAAGAGFLAAASGAAAALEGGGWLLATALGLELGTAVMPTRAALPLRAAAWVAAAWGGLVVLEGGLRGEVVYTALGALGLALVLATGAREHAR